MKGKVLALTVALTAVGALIPSTPAHAYSYPDGTTHGSTGYCYAMVAPKQGVSAVNIRSGASTAYRIVDVMPAGERRYYISTTSNGWYRVKDDLGLTGYVSSTYSYRLTVCV